MYMVKQLKTSLTEPLYRYTLNLDEQDKKTIDSLIARGAAVTFTDAIRFCIREQEKLL